MQTSPPQLMSHFMSHISSLRASRVGRTPPHPAPPFPFLLPHVVIARQTLRPRLLSPLSVRQDDRKGSGTPRNLGRSLPGCLKEETEQAMAIAAVSSGSRNMP